MDDVIPLTDAKARLSAIVKRVESTGVSYIVTVRDKPAVIISPARRDAPKTLHAKGILADRVVPTGSEAERGAWREAVEDRYAARH